MNKRFVLCRNSKTICSILTIVFVCMFNKDISAIGPVYWAVILGSCGLLMCLSAGIKKIRLTPFLQWYMLFVLVSGLSYIWAVEDSNVITALKSLIVNLLIIMSVDVSVRNEEDIRAVMRAVLVASVLTSMYLLITVDWQMVILERIVVTNEHQSWNANEIGLIAMWAIALYLILPQKRGIFLQVLCIVPNLFVLLLSGSRKAWLALVLIMILYSFVHNHGKILKTIFIAFCVFAAAVYLVMKIPFLYEIGGERFEVLIDAMLGKGVADSGTQLRLNYIKLGWEAFLERPFFGYGLDCYRKLLSLSYLDKNTYSHNNYIELLVNGGIVTTLVFYSIYVLELFRGFRWLKRNNGAVTSHHNRLVVYFMGLLVLQLGLQIGMVMYSELIMLVILMLHDKLVREK